MDTHTQVDEYKGKPIFAVYKTPADLEEKTEYPIVSMGVKKAKAILKHAEELKKFVSDNDI